MIGLIFYVIVLKIFMDERIKNLIYALELIKDSREFKVIFMANSLRRKILWRKAAFSAWLSDFICFNELFSYFLPSRLRFLKETKKGRVAVYLDWKLGQLITHSGLDIRPADLPHGPSEMMRLLDGVIVKDQYHAKEFIKKDSIVIDAGANIGVFSIFASGLTPKGHIFAFEPVYKTYEVLLKNIKDYRNIIPVQSALGNRTGRAKIFIHSDLSGPNFLLDSEKADSRQLLGDIEEINLLTIDKFTEDNKLPRVDFIKIDAEGYEKQIIEGALETIKKFSPTIAVSAYHLKGDKELIPALIKSINPQYHYKFSQRNEEDFIFWV